MYLLGGPFFTARPHLPPLDAGGLSSLLLSSSTQSTASCSSSDLFKSSSLLFASFTLFVFCQVLLVFGWSMLDPWRLQESGGAWAVAEQVLGLGLGAIWRDHGREGMYIDGGVKD